MLHVRPGSYKCYKLLQTELVFCFQLQLIQDSQAERHSDSYSDSNSDANSKAGKAARKLVFALIQCSRHRLIA